MVLDAFNESKLFTSYLSIISDISSIIIIAYEAFLDQNPDSDTFVSDSGIYKYEFVYSPNKLTLTIDFGPSQLYIEYYQDYSNRRVTRIQLTESNILKIEETPTKTILATEFGGIRDFYFEIDNSNPNLITGQIYKFTGINDVLNVSNNAMFYITPTYTVAVGNNAGSNMSLFFDLIFSGTICEVYLNSTGKLIGYETHEQLLSTSLTEYNTIHFNLNNVSGMSSIKYDEDEKWYANGSSSEFETKAVGAFGGLKALSRRFDFTMRSQYFYYKDGDDIEKTNMHVPMMFVQEEQVSTFTSDVLEKNPGLNLYLPTSYLTVIKNFYHEYVPIFEELDDKIVPSDIVNFIGSEHIII